MAPSRRPPVYATLLVASLVFAACASEPGGAQATKPQSPADGTGDYNEQNGQSAAGSGTEAPPSGQSTGSEGSVKPTPECPPRCSETGGWIGCGLKKPRGSGCDKCSAPKCVNKPTGDEWYDCAGVMIVQHACGS